MSAPPPNDHEINRKVRAVLSRHWVDLSSTAFASRKGIVRLTGDLKRVGPQAGRPMESMSMNVLDSELKRVGGVQRVHFDLANWRRTEEGEWVRVDREPPAPLPKREGETAADAPAGTSDAPETKSES
jgi:hypothetical protein